MKRHVNIAIVLVVAAGLGWLAYVRSGQIRTVALVPGEVVAGPAGEAGWVAWVQRSGDQSQLMASRRGGRCRVIATGPFSGLAVKGDKAFVAQWPEDPGLLAVSLRDGSREKLAPTGGEVKQIAIGGGTIYWLEWRDAALPEVPFAVAAGPVSVIRSMPEQSGSVSLVAIILPDEKLPPPRRLGQPAQVELVGADKASLYWLRQEAVGNLRRTRLLRSAPGHQPETVALEPGSRMAVLLDDAVLWTSVSQEAAPQGRHTAVKRQRLGDTRVEVTADWLAQDSLLIGQGGRAYAHQADMLWRLGKRRGEQRVVYSRSRRAAVARLIGDQEYLVSPEREGWIILRRPVTWWARARQVLGG